MNVLIFVMTMLMLLAMLTYGRLATYSSSQISQVIFEKYMQNDERAYLNSFAEVLYNEIHKTSKEGDSTPRVSANSLISIAPLFNSAVTEEALKQRKQATMMLKTLMHVLYGDSPFFKEMLEKRPTFTDEIIASLIETSEGLPKEDKWKKVTDLANINLSDKELDAIFYLMLKGAAYKDVLQSAIVSEEDKVNTESTSTTNEDFHSKKGHFSLLDFINLSGTSKIRVYLAPKEVLEVVFPDKKTVDEIINERQQLYKQVVAGSSAAELSKIFESQFDSRRNPEIGRKDIDYTVTKTAPKKSQKNIAPK